MKLQQLADTSLEEIQKKASLVMVLSVFVFMLLMGISDLFFGLNPPMYVRFRFILTIPLLLTYFLMSKYDYYRLGLSFLTIYSLILVSFAYKYNDGFNGPAFFSLVVFVAFITTVFNGWLKLFFIALTFLLFSALYLFEVNGWLLVSSNKSDNNHVFFESFVTLFLVSLFTFFLIHFWVNRYRKKNNLLSIIQIEKEKALKELESLNAKKNELIALLSHDLKNPIGMLEQTLNLVDKGAFEEGELEQILYNLKNQSYYLSAVLNNTLNWVLSELKEGKLDLEKVSLFRLTQDMQLGMLSQAVVKNQKIDFKKFGNDLNIELEVSEIQIILKNVLDNAIKFTPVGGGIEFEVFCSEKEIKWIVKNEGNEIPQKDVNTLFDFKVKTTYGTLREKGTGIGLPLCKRIADKLEMELGYFRTEDGRNSFFLTKNLA
jgi:two-component system sensor histidine kinase/response regulator